MSYNVNVNRVNTKQIPQTSGVYFFKDRRGQVLYIGKAVNLKSRVGSYFNKQPKDSRISKMLELAVKIDWQETNSEIEALILESQLIKKYRPRFNVMLRDDKQYFFVGFTKEPFPKIFLTHQLAHKVTGNRLQVAGKKHTGNNHLTPDTWHLTPDFVGPFTDGGALKTTLRLLRRIFPYCTCKQKHNNYCLNYHIGKCPGFCCLKTATSDKRQATKEKQGYQKNIKAIKSVLEGKRTTVLKNFKKEMLAFGEKHEFERAIELRNKIEKLERVFENAQILRNTAGRDGVSSVDGLAKLLKINRTLHRIEGYDVSNIQGKFATGAMIVFTNGQPDKNQYRKFKIRQNFRTSTGDASGKEHENLGGQVQMGDTAMLGEILIRRFSHPEWPYPDLIIVDGGIGQLNAARSMIPVGIPVIALTKNDKHRGDHVYLSNKKTALPLKKMPPLARNLILQIDAEAHRFAISYYRKLHRRLGG